jgi:23S rRNA pseudouridine2605 synthase
MKDFKNDSTSVLTRFGRDKRQRTVTATAERVERRPRLQRDAADSEQPSDDRKPVKRASYNPHFTEDNRPAFDKPRRSFGDKPRGEKPAYGDNRGPKKFGDRKFGDKPYGERKSGDKPAGDRRFTDKKSGDRRFGDKPYKPGFRKHDDKPASYPKFTPEKQIGEMRLNRFLAQSGLCSRREADDFITAGLVTVNGQIVTQLGTKVLPTDEVKFNDSRVQGEKKVYLVLNKPKGYVTSLDDPHAGKTVMELVQGACTERIYPVGRLDKNSLGLLLFTNDGDLTKQLTHPAFRKKKIYQVSLDKPLTRADMDRIAEGITLEDGEIFADEISYVKDNKQEVGIEIHSGRNRIVRRIFEFLGYTVTKLDRVYYAGLTKKNLKRGAWRFLSREEVERLKSGQYE